MIDKKFMHTWLHDAVAGRHRYAGVSKHFAVVLICFTGIIVWGNELTTQAGIMNFLRNAVEYTENSTFKSKNFTENDYVYKTMEIYFDAKKIRFEWNSATGNRPSRRIISPALGKGEFSWVEDNDGSCLDNKLIHCEYYTNWNYLAFFSAIVADTRLNSGRYSISQAMYKKIPCYRVTARYPSDDRTISQTSAWNIKPVVIDAIRKHKDQNIFSENLTSAEFNEKREELRANYFAILEIYIDKTESKPFIYGFQAYNFRGNKIYNLAWGDIDFLPEINPTLFELPRHVSVKKITSDREYSKIYMKSYGSGATPPKPSIIKRMGAGISKTTNNVVFGIDNNLESITTWLSWILFWFSIVVFALAIVLKIRKRRIN